MSSGKPFWEIRWFSATPGMPETVRSAIPVVAGGESVRLEARVNLPVGGRRWFEKTMRPIRDGIGTVVAIVPEAVELTQRRQAEEALRQAQKMEAIGQLTGGRTAHPSLQRRLNDSRIKSGLTPILGKTTLRDATQN